MSRWLRFYDDAINDPKILKLPEATRWQWVAVLCIASKNDGKLPSLQDVALMLRVPVTKAGAILTQLCSAGLLDKTETGFAPHNWSGRQYKSDVSTDRVKRFRNGKRNVSTDVSETAPETDTESEQKQTTEATASGAIAPVDHRKRLFSDGLAKLATMTGKGPDACRSFVGKCLKAADDDAVVVLGLIEDAERNQVASASSWIAARLKSTGPPTGKPLTAFQQSRQQTQDILDDLDNFARNGSSGSQANPRLLPGNPGERSEGIRGGAGANLVDLSAGSRETRN